MDRERRTQPGNLPAIPRTSKESNFEELKQRIHSKLVDKLDLSRVGELEGDMLRREIRLVVEHLCDSEDTLLNRNERERLVNEVLDETFGLGPLEMLLKDPTISDILINGPKNIYCERRGKMEKTNVMFRDNNHLMQIIDRIVSKVGRRVDETCPMVDARMSDGSRFNAIIPPLALDGACVSIRRFGANPLKLEDLLNYKAFTPEMVMLLEGAIKARLNIVISGGTGSGKTTLLEHAVQLHSQLRPHRDHRGRRRTCSSSRTMFAGRVSSRTTWSCCNCNSAASSMVTMRSVLGMKLESVFKQRRLAGAGAAGNEDVQPGLDRPFQEHHHLGREGLEVQQVFELQRIGAETADGDAGPVQRQRRNDGVETRAVDHAGVDHRAGLVHAPAHLRDDAVDDLHQVVVVAEDDAGLLHLAAALDSRRSSDR